MVVMKAHHRLHTFFLVTRLSSSTSHSFSLVTVHASLCLPDAHFCTHRWEKEGNGGSCSLPLSSLVTYMSPSVACTCALRWCRRRCGVPRLVAPSFSSCFTQIPALTNAVRTFASTTPTVLAPPSAGRGNRSANSSRTRISSSGRSRPTSFPHPHTSANAALQEHHGIFQSQHIKPFPVRAAIDIGTGGVISICIGRVDARVGAIQKLVHQTQLPLYLEKLHTGGGSSTTSFTLSERTVDDIRNKMRVLHGVMRRPTFEGLSERAAVLSWPLCCATNARDVADSLTREFKVDVRVLGDTFNVEWPLSVQLHTTTAAATRGAAAAAAASSSGEEGTSRRVAMPTAAGNGQNRLKALLRGAVTTKGTSGSSNTSSNTTTDDVHTASDRPRVPSARAQVDTLAFLAHAAVSQCVAPQRLIVISEDPQRGLRLIGLGTSPAADVADLLADAESAEAVAKLNAIAFGARSNGGARTSSFTKGQHIHPSGACAPSSPSNALTGTDALQEGEEEGGLCVTEHLLPVDVAMAHHHCITEVQRRSEASYGLHTSSPNPLLAEEFAALRYLLTERLRHNLPSWVLRKSQLGGMVAGTSFNGGLLNIAARVAQQTCVSLDHMEVHAQHHFCGLTDVLLAENFPNPLLVLPSAALAASVLRAVESPRFTYLPELSVAAALLVQPSLWLASRAADVRRRLARDAFYAPHTAAQRGRTFSRPHRKDNPTAAPDATWVKGGRWNDLSYETSMKGT